jgi:hypothetical protein
MQWTCAWATLTALMGSVVQLSRVETSQGMGSSVRKSEEQDSGAVLSEFASWRGSRGEKFSGHGMLFFGLLSPTSMPLVWLPGIQDVPLCVSLPNRL